MMTSQKKTTVSRPSLFPSANSTSSDTASFQNLDWLENKSFTSETAQKVVVFQEELRKLQKESDNDSDDSDDDNEVKINSARLVAAGPGTSKVAVDLTQTIPDICSRPEQKPSRYRQDDKSHDSEENSYKKKKKRKRHTSSDNETDSERKKKKNKHKHKKKHKKERHQPKEKRVTEIPGIFESKKIFLDDIADIAPKHAFKLDRAPDTNSWTYGSLYSGHVANYRSACNQCVGSARDQHLFMKDRDKKKKEKVLNERYYSKENRRVIKQPPEEIINVLKEEKIKKVDIPMYIPVKQSNDGEAGSENKDIRQKILDESTSLYVMGKAKETDKLDADETIPDPVRLKVADYNKQLRETPTDVKLWLEFVRFQDKLVLEDGSNDSELAGKKTSARGVLEKKLSILDKALELNPANIELLLAKIELSSEISDTVKINKELEQLLFVHVANTRLWKYYLIFNQSRISVFTVTKMTKLYHKCFKTLFGVLEGKLQTHSVPENLETEVLDIFLRYCYFLKHTGYREKAMATFQAGLEYNLFAPPSLAGVSRETKMAAFEEFWDSSCPRIGTVGAVGWKNWKEQSGNVDSAEENSTDPLEDLEEAIIEKKLSKPATWLEIEALREKHHWLPWQPGQGQTEDNCEDVERLVMFDDVSPVLFNIAENLHFELVVSFLKFLCLPTQVSLTAEQSGIFCENVIDVTRFCQGSVNEDVIFSPNNESIRSFAVELLKLAIPCFAEKRRTDLTLCLIETQLGNYETEHLSKSDKKEMKKIMKNVLKEENNRNDLFVWSAYIDLERLIGKPGEGESVIEMALTMYSGGSVEPANEHTVGLISLYCQYCEMLLQMDKEKPCKLLPRTLPVSSEIKKKVLSVINCLMEARKFNSKDLTDISGAGVLKTLSTLSRLCSTSREIVCSKGACELSKEQFLKLIWCHGLFVYCKSGLSSSLDIYSSVITSLANCSENLSNIQRRLYEDQLKLIVFHMSTSSSPLHILRERLDIALQRFPDDPVFLLLFVDVERKSRISGRFNLFFDRWCRTVEAPTPAVIAVLFQLDFIQDMKNSDNYSACHSGLVHRARAWLEHSLSLSNLQHCPVLWRLFFLVEKLADSGGSGGRLKGVFYRAVQQCPWNKSIYMDGVRLFGVEQLQEMVDLMTEKELRVQIPVEELDILMSS
ncbi:nuclear exosome regulator NRDE2-like [Mercenaria mercenaria]|uniref:nuclear exosome regulator NRDE2-like n=1 Tax=Mercenaria mercenaria TaxID=6596 RepID=UPI00234F8A37|nr:nuclear exosome regulator NRDE2-like [Mercenaria mercenaria]